MTDKKHVMPALNVSFNAKAYERSTIGGEPNSNLSEYEREARKDFYRTEFHNPLGAVTSRFASIHTSQQRLIERIKKDKDDFLDLIIFISIQQMREKLDEMLEDIQKLINDMQKLRNELDALLTQNLELLHGAERAIEDNDSERDEDGNYTNKFLREFVDRYMKRNDLDCKELREMSDKQLRQMVLDEIKNVEIDNIELSCQLDIVDTGLVELREMEGQAKAAQDVINSDLPEHIKQKTVSDIFENVDLTEFEKVNAHMKQEVDRYKQDNIDIGLNQGMNKKEVNNVQENATISPKDSLLASI